MQRDENPASNSAAQVVPAIRSVVPWRVLTVEPLAGFRLRVAFVDGTQGDVEMPEFLRDPRIDGTVFEALRDPEQFALARVELGAVQWPSGADLAPDAMHAAIRKEGKWVLSADIS